MRRASSTDAPDVCSEIFLVAWRRLAIIPQPMETLLYIYGIAARVLANQTRSLRHRARLEGKLQSLGVVVAPDPATQVLRTARNQKSRPPCAGSSRRTWVDSGGESSNVMIKCGSSRTRRRVRPATGTSNRARPRRDAARGERHRRHEPGSGSRSPSCRPRSRRPASGGVGAFQFSL